MEGLGTSLADVFACDLALRAWMMLGTCNCCQSRLMYWLEGQRRYRERRGYNGMGSPLSDESD